MVDAITNFLQWWDSFRLDLYNAINNIDTSKMLNFINELIDNLLRFINNENILNTKAHIDNWTIASIASYFVLGLMIYLIIMLFKIVIDAFNDLMNDINSIDNKRRWKRRNKK